MFIADLHIHSKYSRATSRDCVPEMLDLFARRKGLDLIGTGDFTHRVWRQELAEKLIPTGDGLYRLRADLVQPGGVAAPVRFIVSGEISSIYKKDGRVRKVHNVILLPGLEAAEALSRRLEAIGNLQSDGRPILGLDSRDLLEITLETCPDAVFIPAHIWTPHFSLFGAYSGFDTIEACFGDLTGHIHALETGLSSDPPMNWRLSALDRFALVSNSDAHSPANLAREANLFDTELSYAGLAGALNHPNGDFLGTLEFFPEEGKYHFDGHRNCGICQQPADTIASGGKCPVCGGRITVGVLHRVEALADRPEGFTPPGARRFESLVPLPEVVAACTGFSPVSKRGAALAEGLRCALGPELFILRQAPPEDIGRAAGPAVAEGIRRLRAGEIRVRPGFDGEYGKVSILSPDEIAALSGQTRLFLGGIPPVKPTGAVSKPASTPNSAPKTDQSTAAEAVPPPTAPDALNAEQRAAAFSEARVTAVIAGPGTGKTKTLVARAAHLIEERGVPPARIAAVTFTNKAAGEMRERLARQFGGPRAVRAMTVGTFHAICLGLLRKGGMEPVILDEAAAQATLAEVIRDTGVKISVRDAMSAISLRKCGVEPTDAPAALDTLYDAYRDRLHTDGAMDFDDILLAALDALEDGGGDTAIPAAPAFDHLLVDEFQDMNPVQYRLLRKWAEKSQSVFVIGDPNQAIYGFRGSDARCFNWLRQDFPDLAEIALARNYRSTAEVLAAAAPIVAVREKDSSRTPPTAFHAIDPCRPGGKDSSQNPSDGAESDPPVAPDAANVATPCHHGGTPSPMASGSGVEAGLPVAPDAANVATPGHPGETPAPAACGRGGNSSRNPSGGEDSGTLAAPDAANAAPSHRPATPPTLIAERGSGGRIRLILAGDAAAEARFVAQEIARIIGGIDMLNAVTPVRSSPPRAFSDIAVLYRTNRQAAALESSFVHAGIPHVVAGRDAFLTDPDLAKALAFFRLLLNPKDTAALRACLTSLAGCAPEQGSALLSAYRNTEKTLDALARTLLGDAAPTFALGALAAQISEYGPKAHKEKPRKLIARWLAEQFRLPEQSLPPEHPPGETDWADKLLRTAVFHDTMGDLLRAITLGGEADLVRYGGEWPGVLEKSPDGVDSGNPRRARFSKSASSRYAPDAVTLMTFHAAKGLEFPAVFLCGVTDGLIPHRGNGGRPASEAEERRLLYVGMTRAKDELILVAPGAPSPFLEDIPAALAEREVLPKKAAARARQVSLFE